MPDSREQSAANIKKGPGNVNNGEHGLLHSFEVLMSHPLTLAVGQHALLWLIFR
jgi:hypothetical protein